MDLFDPAVARAVPSGVRFGGSTWTYPDWKGLVYRHPYDGPTDFRRRCLAEYAECPLFRTVGIDHTFYAPATAEVLGRYAEAVGGSFRWVCKAWERVTTPRFPDLPRYGKRRGSANEDFLSASLFEEAVLPAYREGGVRGRTGPFVFQFPRIDPAVLDAEEFLGRLRHFLGLLPRDFSYAVEVRNREFLVPDYFGALNSAGAAHCFNHWSYMPPLREQMKAAAAAGGLAAPFLVARILTPLGVSYEAAKRMASPYSSLKRRDDAMRDDVRRLVGRAVRTGRELYVIVNNRCEGCAPLTIAELAVSLGESLGGPPGGP